MGTRHKHADVIIAWANGEEIELWGGDEWVPWLVKKPPHYLDHSYRIKPKRIKKEGWVNVYRNDLTMHDTKEKADECASALRVACVRIEWEEEA
jgi:hypothetical protein